MSVYEEVPAALDLPLIERRMLALWRDTEAFKKRMDMNRGSTPWSFIDGPITANNPMGVHHAWGRTYKDLYQRYKAMRGFDLRYQNGFDCQGLWVEVEVEKELGLQSKGDIEDFGVSRFINRCKERVLRFSAIQVEQSKRLGYWMDWDDVSLLRELAERVESPEELVTVKGGSGVVTDSVERIIGKLGTPELGGSYFTFSNENNYTIWAVLKRCHERGWIYKGRDVMPWCPRCSTALSQHEIATEGYREITHLGVTLRLPLKERSGESLLVWTTTPWTLTSNVAAAVNPDMIYLQVEWRGETVYLGEDALETVFKEMPRVTRALRGRELEGWAYKGPFDALPAEQEAGADEAHRVILWQEVSETEGTGIVHIAPGCGREDFELSRKHCLPVVAPLDEYGVFMEGYGCLSGKHVYDSQEAVIDHLRSTGLLFKVENYVHRYPVCWRCGSELVFRLVDEWFISMGEKLDKPLEDLEEEEFEDNLRYQIMESAEKVNWIPSHGLQQELDWLQNMDDWMISKKRYWGLALPIWECGRCGFFEVVGSEKELEERAVEGWERFEGHTPHRPWIDAVRLSCPQCQSSMSRIEDVGNPWLDAGVVAYSTLNYLHDRCYWRKWFPADLICESLPGQFRNWFYSMLTMSTILEGDTPFLTCLGYGLVLAEDGREMHKSWGNAIWFDEAVERMGAEVMRWMFCTNRADSNLLFGYKQADEVKRRFLIPLWNIYSFFVTYANLDEWRPENSTSELSQLDHWILSRLQVLIKKVTDDLEAYDAYNATIEFQKFIDELSTWYIRRSRRRFWKSESDVDKRAAYTTLYACLTTLMRLLAPFTPFLTEAIYQNLEVRVSSKSLKSIHHNKWPKADPTMIDKELMTEMDLIIRASSLGRSARNKSGIKLRQPLKEARIVGGSEFLKQLEGLKHLLKEELNVKGVTLTNRKDELFEHKIRLLPQKLGRKYGSLLPKIEDSLPLEDTGDLIATLREGGSISLEVEDRTVTLMPEEVEIVAEVKEGWVVVRDEEMLVGINTTLDEELKREGLARDLVRRIQNQRKEAGFNISDEIELYYQAGPKITEAFDSHGKYIADETLSQAIHKTEPPKEAYSQVFSLRGEELRMGLVLAKSDES